MHFNNVFDCYVLASCILFILQLLNAIIQFLNTMFFIKEIREFQDTNKVSKVQ